MNDLQLHIGEEYVLQKLSLKVKFTVCLSVCLFFLFGQLIVPLWLLAVIAIAPPVSYIIIKNEFRALLLLLAVYAFLALKPRSDSNTATPLEIIAGILIMLVVIPILIKILFFTQERLTYDLPQKFLMFYFIWTICVGIIGMVFWRNTFNNWMREILLQLPFFIVPVIMVRNIDLTKESEKKFKITVVLTWIVIIIANVILLKRNIAQAYYLFQTGRASMNIALTSLMLLSFVSLSFTDFQKKNKHIIYGGILLAIFGVGISFFRTAWITNIVMVVALFPLAISKERKKGLKSLSIIFMILVSTIAALCIVSPLFYLFVRSYIDRLLSASQFTVDPSLVNRYIEWRRVWTTIINSPIAGYGYGAEFYDYNWISGMSYWTGYTHSGYLGLLLKGGIIGFFFLSAAYGLLIYKGIKLAKNLVLNEHYRALVRAGVVFLIGILLSTITLNALAERDQLFWAGVVWGYFLLCEKYLSDSKSIIHIN